MTHHIRVSALPRAGVCPASVVQSEGHPDVSDAPTALGRAYHDAMAWLVNKGGDVPLIEIAGQHGAPVEELMDLWTRFGFEPHEKSQAEVEVILHDRAGKLAARGRLDYVEPIDDDPGWWRLVDWKTTRRVDEDPEPWTDLQTQAYAVGFLQLRGDAKGVRIQKAYPRRGPEGWTAEYAVSELNYDEVEERILSVIERAQRQFEKPAGERSYTMSHHCTYCPGRVDCPAIRKEVQAAVEATKEVFPLTKKNVPSKKAKLVYDVEITLENAPKLHRLAQLLRRSNTALQNALRDFIGAVGPVEVEDGKYLAMVTRTKRAPLNQKNLLEVARRDGLDMETIEKAIAGVLVMPPTEEERLDVYNAEDVFGRD